MAGLVVTGYTAGMPKKIGRLLILLLLMGPSVVLAQDEVNVSVPELGA